MKMIDMHYTQNLADEAATLALGQKAAQTLQAPLVIYLQGDLGAGKTTFTRGLLRGLGFAGSVKSPTYAIVESYELSCVTINHFDLYRFASPEEWHDAGLDDLFAEDAIHLIEWPLLGGDYVPQADIVMTFTVQGEGRLCTIEACSQLGKQSIQPWLS